MKRGDLLRHLRKHGCYLKREGRSHSLWISPAKGAIEAVPRHTEIRRARRPRVSLNVRRHEWRRIAKSIPAYARGSLTA